MTTNAEFLRDCLTSEKKAFKAGMIAALQELTFELMGTRTIPNWDEGDHDALNRLFDEYKQGD